MDTRQDAAIDLVEAAYDLEVPAGDWLPNLMRAGAPLLDMGLGFYGAVTSGRSPQGVPIFVQTLGSPGAEDLPIRVMEAARDTGPELVSEISRSLEGSVSLLSEVYGRWPDACESVLRHVGGKDILSLTAVDPDSQGVNLSIVSPKVQRLEPRELRRWNMLCVHLAAGHRLRRGLGQAGDAEGVAVTEPPPDAEALVDPKRFLVSHATGEARDARAAAGIRDAARAVDRARGPLRKSDPEEALRLWKGLVRGRWSLVDWFDSDGRRFVLARPNAPKILDPRGLTKREAQVTTYAAAGESRKMIAYRLGLSQTYVSTLLRDGMRKLGVKTQAQLVEKMRGVAQREPAA